MRRKKVIRRGGDNGSYWISYSDMMAGMLFTFALILFMAVYQLVELQQKKAVEIQTKEAQISSQQSLLLDQEAEIADKEELLATSTLMIEEQQKEIEEKSAMLAIAEANIQDQQRQIDEQEALLASQQEQIDQLIGMRSRIIEDLRDELSAAGLDATVDRKTGAIAFSGAVLFDSGQNVLKPSGKRVLNTFIPIYVRTLMREENRGYIGEIIIEGHTDPDGTYLDNMELSQQRAFAVAAYCLGPEMTGLTPEEKLFLQEILTVNGRSYSDPVYMPDGVTVDKDSSRRVVFKFRMKDTEMIDQMSLILEGSDQQGD